MLAPVGGSLPLSVAKDRPGGAKECTRMAVARVESPPARRTYAGMKRFRSMEVGIVVERCALQGPWQSGSWRPVPELYESGLASDSKADRYLALCLADFGRTRNRMGGAGSRSVTT